jgi:hypothetical protein
MYLANQIANKLLNPKDNTSNKVEPITSQGYLDNYNTLQGLVPAYNNAAQNQASTNKITKDYNDLVQQTMNDYDRRGMLGSGAFAKYMTNNVDYGLGQGLAAYQGQAESNANAYNLQTAGLQQTAMQNILAQQEAAQGNQLKQSQFNQQLNYNKQKLALENQIAQEELKQKKIAANRAAGKPDYW